MRRRIRLDGPWEEAKSRREGHDGKGEPASTSAGGGGQ